MPLCTRSHFFRERFTAGSSLACVSSGQCYNWPHENIIGLARGGMSAPSPQDVTELLMAWTEGNQTALEKLAPQVHAELYRLARRYMGQERPGHILQTTALINEAYVRLI